MRPVDDREIALIYEQTVLEAARSVVEVIRLGKRTIRIDGKNTRLIDFMAKMTDGGRELFSIRGKYRRDKIDKPSGQVVAKAGEEYYFPRAKMGACKRQIKGVGSPLGPPEERYRVYTLFTVCGERPGYKEWQTRHLGVDDITQLTINRVTYNFVEPYESSEARQPPQPRRGRTQTRF